MKDKSLMRLIIDCPNFVKEKMLTDNQRWLFSEIECQDGGVTSSFLVNEFDYSVQNASTQLYNLYGKGYLKRSERTHETGGIEYVYKAAI